MRYSGLLLIAALILGGELLFSQDTLVFERNYLPGVNRTLVFSPGVTDTPSAGFPLVYLLHGYDGSSSDWNKHISLKKVSDETGFIIVCPDGYKNSWYVESPIQDSCKYRTFFNHDLIPEINKRYKINKSGIFITGLSMGGQGAINIFLDNRDYFRSAGSMSGILNITAYQGKWQISQRLGSYDEKSDEWNKYNCVYKISSVSNPDFRLIVNCGTEDFAYPVNVEFKNAAEKAGVKIKFISEPGNHNWDFWVKSLPVHLKFFKDMINK